MSTTFGQMMSGDLPEVDPAEMKPYQTESRQLFKLVRGYKMEESRHRPKKSKFIRIESSELKKLCASCDSDNKTAESLTKSTANIPDNMAVAILRIHAEAVGWVDPETREDSPSPADDTDEDEESESGMRLHT